jgi:hypothetical protein
MASLAQEGLDCVGENIWGGCRRMIGGLNEKDVILEARSACKKQEKVLE